DAMDTDIVYYGMTLPTDVSPGMESYCNSLGHDYWGNYYSLHWDYLWSESEMFADLRYEVDAGNPCLMNTWNHTICAMGYSTTGGTVLLHDSNSSQMEFWNISNFWYLFKLHPRPRNDGISVLLQSPDGGHGFTENGNDFETLRQNGIYEITWDGDQPAGSTVELFYNTNPAQPLTEYVLIDDNAPNIGYYPWKVPTGLNSTSARIMVQVKDANEVYQGYDGSNGEFTITTGGSIPALTNGVGLHIPDTGSYYTTFPSTPSTWVVAGMRQTGNSQTTLDLYDHYFSDRKASSISSAHTNWVLVDKNHVVGSSMGLGVRYEDYPENNFLQSEAAAQSLSFGTNSLSWSTSDVVKMYDLQLDPGNYTILLNHVSGHGDLGFALYSSQGETYYRTRDTYVAFSDAESELGSEAFSIWIPTADIYGLLVWSNSPLTDGNVQIIVGNTGLWEGDISTAWNTAGNWATNTVPNATTDVYIPGSAVRKPVISGGITAVCRNLTIGAGAFINLGAATLTVNGYTQVYGQFITSGEGTLNLMNNTLWYGGSQLVDNADCDICLYGNWIAYEDSNVIMDVSTLNCLGSRDAHFSIRSEDNYFNYLHLRKTGGAELEVVFSSTASLNANFFNQVDGIFRYSSDYDLCVGRYLYCNGGLRMDNGAIRFVGDQVCTVNVFGPNVIGSVQMENSGGVYMSQSLQINGSVYLDSGQLLMGSSTLSLGGDWVNSGGTLIGDDYRIVFTGDANASCNEAYIKTLELAKTGNSELRILHYKSVSCDHYDWTSGVIHVYPYAEFTANDLVDNRILGGYILESGTINLHQDSNQYVDLDADLYIYSGSFNIHGGDVYPSEWAYTRPINLYMEGGVLDFIDNGVWLRNTGHTINETISGGFIRTSGDFKVERGGFNPTEGIIELYGTNNVVLHVNSPSQISTLLINKTARTGEGVRERNSQVSVDGNTKILETLTLTAGTLRINHALLEVGGYCSISGALYMDSVDDILDVGGSLMWHEGSSGANLSAGTIYTGNTIGLAAGCNISMPAAVSIILKNTGSSQRYVYNYEPTAAWGTIIDELTSGQAIFGGTTGNTLNGDLVIKTGATTSVNEMNTVVYGKVDIWLNATLNLGGYATLNTYNLYNSGLLNLPANYHGLLTVSNTFLQYSTGTLALHGGELLIDTPYDGSTYTFGGTTSMSGGVLKISNNGMQIGSSGFSFSGGEIKVGWNFLATNPNTFSPTEGIVELIGNRQASLSLGSGNKLPTLILRKTGSTGAVTMLSDITIARDCLLHMGKLHVNNHVLTVSRDLEIYTYGQLYANNDNDEIRIGGKWTNNGDTNNFMEGSGLVSWITSPNAKQITTPETFHHVRVTTGTSFLDINEDLTVNVSGNLQIDSGRLRPKEGSILNVSGSISLNGENSFLDQNFRRNSTQTQVHIGANLIINEGSLLCLDTNPEVALDQITIAGYLSMTGGEIYTLDTDITLTGELSTTASSYVSMRGGTFTNTHTGTWQTINCPWETYGNIFEFPNKGLDFVTGASLDNNSFTHFKVGKGLKALPSNVFSTARGTFEFIGSSQSDITLGGNNLLPGIRVNKSGAQVMLNSPVRIVEDLEILSGTFNSNGYAVELNNDWINEAGTAGYTPGTSTVTLKAEPSSSSLSGSQNFYNLVINHPDPDNLTYYNSGESTVLNNLTLQEGKLVMNGGRIQVNGAVAIDAGGRLSITAAEFAFKQNLADNNPSGGLELYPNSLLTMNGSINQNIITQTTGISVGSIKLDKSSGSFLPTKSIAASGDVQILRGYWNYGTSGLSHSFGGNLSISSGAGFTDNTGTISFTGNGNSILSNAGTANFKNITVNKSSDTRTPSSLSLGTNLTLSTPGAITVNGGVLNLAGYTLQTKGDVDINSDGKLAIAEGGILKMLSGSTININDGGILQSIGTSGSNATITRIEAINAYYNLFVNSGGTIAAERTIFEYTGPDGVYIKDGAAIDPAHSFAYCTFRYGYSSGSLMTINNDQAITIDHASFPSGATSFYNVSKNLDQGTVQFTNETGGWAGSGHEMDYYSRINWSSDVPEIQVNPPLFNFGEVLYTQSSTRNMLISNPGSAVLHGTISTPQCFSITPWGRTDPENGAFTSAAKADYEHGRNVLSYQIPIGGSATFTITFTPLLPEYYSGNIVVTHNAVGTPINVFVDGYGVGSRIFADPRTFNIDIQPGEIAHRNLSISNIGVDSLSYSAWVYYAREDRNTLLYTGFEDSCPPAGWTEVQVAGNEGDWAQAAATVHPNGTPPVAGSFLGYFNSYSTHVNNRRRLQSPELDLSDYTGLSLSFWMFHDAGYPSYYDTLQVQVSVNGGAWMDAGNYILRCTMPYEWRQHIIDLSAYDQNANLRVGFLAKSGYGNDMHIDEVLLSGNYQMPTDWITMNGETFLWGGLTPEDPPLPIDIAIDSDDLPSGWYMNQLRFMSNDPGNPDLPVYLNIRVGTPDYTLSPQSLDFGEVSVGESDSLDFAIINTGQIGLSGTLTTPPGFHVVLTSGIREEHNGSLLSLSSKSTRNSVDFYIYPGIVLGFRLGFIPTEAIDYTGQIVISTNTGVDEFLPVSGSGVALPVVANGTVTDIGIESAVYHGEVISTGNQDLIQRGIVWNTYGNPTLIDDVVILSPGQAGSFNIPFASLVHSQTYYIKSFAGNALGTVLGDEICFTTLSPELTVTPDSLPDFGHVALGHHSAPCHITVSGQNLVDMVSFSCGQGFQLSLSETGDYGNEVILYPTDYILAPTNVYIRFSPTTTGQVTELLFPMTV
ncbi:MAG: hypothetical protein PHI68_03030, partial [Candidatus Cloacimonetes bacterium]|nr:hypothetical protein [Candidatus Cloacimonadota bacterium]